MYADGRKYPRVCVSATILNAERKILLTKRSQTVWFPGTWCLPGGHVEGGEDWITAIRNEVLEEVGLKIRNEKLVGVYSDPTVNIIEDSASGEKKSFVSASFLVTDFEGEVKLSEEVSEVGWFCENELPPNTLEVEGIKARDAFRFNSVPFVR